MRGGRVGSVAGNNCQRVSGAESDYPPFFLTLEREISLPENAMRHHIFTRGNLTPASIEEVALRISEKRARDIFRNTVFEAPRRWHAWKTKRGPRIVSSEKVETVQCERKGGRGKFHVTWTGKRYAIFRRNGHLMTKESFES